MTRQFGVQCGAPNYSWSAASGGANLDAPSKARMRHLSLWCARKRKRVRVTGSWGTTCPPSWKREQLSLKRGDRQPNVLGDPSCSGQRCASSEDTANNSNRNTPAADPWFLQCKAARATSTTTTPYYTRTVNRNPPPFDLHTCYPTTTPLTQEASPKPMQNTRANHRANNSEPSPAAPHAQLNILDALLGLPPHQPQVDAVHAATPT